MRIRASGRSQAGTAWARVNVCPIEAVSCDAHVRLSTCPERLAEASLRLVTLVFVRHGWMIVQGRKPFPVCLPFFIRILG